MANRSRGRRLAYGLGLFSLGLGLTELAAPELVARAAGLRRRHRKWLRIFGARELASGVLIFAQARPTAALWTRVAGDALDLAALGRAYNMRGIDRERLMFALGSVAGVTALDVYCGWKLAHEDGYSEVRTHAITVNRSPEEVYRFFCDFENLPKFMSHLESVQMTGGNRSHWVAKAPAGRTVEWDAEVIDDRPGRKIAWRSLKGSDVENTGSVYFCPAPGGRGTEIYAQIEYNPPLGLLGQALAGLSSEDPGRQMKADLFRLKQVLETGEVVHSDASIHEGMHPGQPPEGERHWVQ